MCVLRGIPKFDWSIKMEYLFEMLLSVFHSFHWLQKLTCFSEYTVITCMLVVH